MRPLGEAKTVLLEAGVSYADIEKIVEGMDAFQRVCHQLSRKSGWWHNKDGSEIDPFDKNVFGTKIALVHSEVSEAMEGGRKGLQDAHLPHRKSEEVEAADAMIRIGDLGEARAWDLPGAILEKLAYNQNRPDHKPEARNAEGGKSF